MRRAYDTWDESRKKPTANNCRKPRSDPQQRVLQTDNSRAGTTRIGRPLSFLRPKPHPYPNNWGEAGGFKNQVPTALRQGRTLDNHAADAQQRPTRESANFCSSLTNVLYVFSTWLEQFATREPEGISTKWHDSGHQLSWDRVRILPIHLRKRIQIAGEFSIRKLDFILTCEMPTQSLPLFHLIK